MMAEPFDWTDLIEGARLRCADASKNRNAALDVIRQSAVALRGLLHHDTAPDPERRVYLAGLLKALERIEDGTEPASALNLRPTGRTRDERLFGRNLKAFILVGRELDKLTESGQTRGDKPIDEAKRRAAKATGLPRATIDRLWTDFGSSQGWKELRTEVG